MKSIRRVASVAVVLALAGLSVTRVDAADPRENAAEIAGIKAQLAQITIAIESIADRLEQPAPSTVQYASASTAGVGKDDLNEDVLRRVLREYNEDEAERKLACALKRLLKCAAHCAHCGKHGHGHGCSSYEGYGHGEEYGPGCKDCEGSGYGYEQTGYYPSKLFSKKWYYAY